MDSLVTKTLAEIYLQQGHFEEAYSLFKTLSELDPENVDLKNRLRELEEKVKFRAHPVRTGQARPELPGDVDMSAPPPTSPDRVEREHTADLPAAPSRPTQSTPRDPKKIQNLEKWLNNIRERRRH